MKRGQPAPLRRDLRSTFEGVARAHSEKPEEFYQIVETAFPAPRAELFARRRRAGWLQFGNELPALAAG
jgi:N6-adenosine-specific RNA methylase IME4